MSDYLDNKSFYKEICLWLKKRNGVKNYPVNEILGTHIKLVVDNYIKRYNWSNYTWKDSMKTEAYLNCLKYAHNFNPEKYDNPHTYFTRVCWSSFLRIIDLEKKEGRKRKELLEKLYCDSSFNYKKKNDKDLEEYNSLDTKDTFLPLKITRKGKKYVFNTKKEYMMYNKIKKWNNLEIE